MVANAIQPLQRHAPRTPHVCVGRYDIGFPGIYFALRGSRALFVRGSASGVRWDLSNFAAWRVRGDPAVHAIPSELTNNRSLEPFESAKPAVMCYQKIYQA